MLIWLSRSIDLFDYGRWSLYGPVDPMQVMRTCIRGQIGVGSRLLASAMQICFIADRAGIHRVLSAGRNPTLRARSFFWIGNVLNTDTSRTAHSLAPVI